MPVTNSWVLAPKFDVTNKDTISHSELGIEAKIGSTFIGVVEKAIQKFDDQEFMVFHVEKLLKGMGEAIESKSPRAKIANTLAKLATKGVIDKTHAGIGNDPHRYKLRVNKDSHL